MGRENSIHPPGATYQSLGWSLREWRRASPWSQKGRGSRNTKRERWTQGTGANVAPRGAQGSMGVLVSSPKGTCVPSACRAQAGEARSAGPLPTLCPQTEQAGTQHWGGPLLHPVATASRTFTISSASLTDLSTLQTFTISKKKKGSILLQNYINSLLFHTNL